MNYLRLLNLAALLSPFALFVSPASAAAPAAKPNILFLLSDDHSYPHLGAYGNRDLRTPALDGLAAQGLRFDRMFVACPQCVPSRATLMTGRSPVSIKMVRFTSALPAGLPALPDQLRDRAGYFTGVGGRSYHLDGPPPNGKHAAPVISGVLDGKKLRTFKQRVNFVDNGGVKDFDAVLGRFLDAAPKNQPWFFWLGFSDPHHVWDASRAGSRIDPAKLTLPPYLPDLPEVRADYARYLAEIEHLDDDVGAVLALLEKRGQARDTIVVFMGDNGMAFPHGKGALHDPGIAVPLMVRWPGVVPPGGVTRELISGEDFAPTLLEIAGVKPPDEMTGVSYLKLLRGEPFTGRKYIFAERGPHGGDGSMRPDIPAANFDLSRCVRSANWKLIYNCTPHQRVQPVDSAEQPYWQAMVAANAAGKLAPEFVTAYFTAPRPTYELYDLATDPGELRNLAGDPRHAAIERELKVALTEKMVLDWDFLPTPLR
ncbi:MAG: sulfatase [Opitutaceae bacterium]|nr:sulfatase [Opitutaceae bacterium]